MLIAGLSPWMRSVLDWLGYDFRPSGAGGEPELVWTNLPTSFGVFILLAIVAAVLWGVYWLYRRELDTCPRYGKLLLALLRATVVILLTVIFLGPALVYLQTRTIQPAVVVARDASQSMNTADRYAEESDAAAAAAVLNTTESTVRNQRPTRTQIVNQMLSADGGRLLSALATRGKIVAMDFAGQAKPLDVEVREAHPIGSSAFSRQDSRTKKEGQEPVSAAERALALPPLLAEGRGTDLANAIRQAMAVDRAAAIVVFTDGQHTGKDDPRLAAREAGERGVPLFIVGVGDPSRPRNLKLTNLYVRPQVWQEEPFEIDAVVSAQGLEAGEVRVELIEQRVGEGDSSSGGGTVVQSLQLPIPEGGGQLRVPFSHTVKEAGRFVYSVRVVPAADELDEADNQLTSAVVRVLTRERIRVLLVAGAPTWEYRLVQKLLARDKTITLSCWLQTLDEERAQEGTRPITRLPISRDELFYYDVVLLLDPNPQEFDKDWIELLKQFVGEHSGGLLFMAGPKHSGRLLTSARTAEFGNLLPVSFGDVGALEVAALLSTNQRAWPLKVIPANADHPVMQFYPEREETLRRWETLPGIFWSFPSQEARPTAQVLVEHSDPTLRSVEGSRPLMVAGRYGSGHTLYLGFNGTWRWRRAGRQAEFFDKFWIQAIRFLVEGRSLEGRRRGYVQTDRDRYEVGERITIAAQLQDASYNPLAVQKVEAMMQAPGDPLATVTLMPVPSRPGNYEASLIARQTGVHTVRIHLPSSESQSDTLETPFTVELPGVEINQVWLNKPLLVELASLSGGKYLDVQQIDDLTEMIPDRTQTVEVRSPPQPLWDVPGMLMALVGLLSMEWLVRKRFKLL